MEADGIRVEVHRRPGSDLLLRGALRGLRRRSLAFLVALPPLLFVLYLGVQVVIDGFRTAPGPQLLAVVIALVITAVIIVRQVRRQRPPALPGQRWCSRTGLYPEPYDADGAGGFQGSAAFAAAVVDTSLLPTVRLVLTSSAVHIVPLQPGPEPLRCDLADIATIGVTAAGRTERGVTITRRDGRVARILVQPDAKLLRELRRLGAAAGRPRR